MGHGITASDRYGEVRVNGQRAWHGLGVEIEDGLSAQEAFEEVGLGWQTELAPLYALVGEGEEQVRVPVVDKYAHVRCDNHSVLGVVSDKYGPIENQDMAKFADALVGADAAVTVETAGSLYGGRRVFCLVRLPKSIEVTNRDILEQYVLISNGHGGFARFSCYPTSVRVVCANTLRWSERDVGRGISFVHTGKLDVKIKQAKTALGLAIQETAKFEKQVQAMAKRQFTKAKAKVYMEELWEETFGQIDPAQKEAAAKMLAKRDAVVEKWMENLDHAWQVEAGVGGTVWGAYNAVSQWHDHERGLFNSIDKSDARVHSNLFGVSQKHKLRAYRKALAAV